MITAIRRSFKSRAYKIVLWLTFLAVGGVFSVFELGRSFFGTTGGNWILQVNHQEVSAPEFARSIASQEERINLFRMQYGQYADLYFQLMGMSLNPQELALNALIQKLLLNSIAKKLPLQVSDELAQSMLHDPAFLTQELPDLVPFSTWDPSLNGINPLSLHAYLQQIGVSSSLFNDELVQACKRDDTKKLVEQSVYIAQAELKDRFAQTYLGHKFTLVTLSAADMLAAAKKEPVSDESLKAYYDLINAKSRTYYVPEKRSAQVITFDPAHYGIVISDDEAQTYYNNNKAQFIDQATQVQVRRILLKVENAGKESEVRQKAQAIHSDLLKNPQTFAKVAKELSHDTKSAEQGGLVPYFSKGKHDKTFEKTSFLLKEDGAISDIIRTNEGFEIVQRIGKKMQTFKPLASVSNQIKEVLRDKKFAQQFPADVRSVLNQPDHAKALEKFAKEKAGKISPSKDITADDTVLAKTIFRLKKNESSFYQDRTQGVVVTATDIKEGYLPPLDQIKNTVKEDYYHDRAQKNMAARLEQIQKAGSWQQVGICVEKTGWLRHSHDYKDDEKEKQELTKKGFDLGRAFQLENIGALATYEHNGSGYVIRLDEIAPFEQALFDAKKSILASELKRQKESIVVAGFVASLYRNAKINKNESLIRKES